MQKKYPIAADDEDVDDEETDASDDGNAAANAVNPPVKTNSKRKSSSSSINAGDNGKTQLRRSKRIKASAKQPQVKVHCGLEEEDDKSDNENPPHDDVSFDEPSPIIMSDEDSSTTAEVASQPQPLDVLELIGSNRIQASITKGKNLQINQVVSLVPSQSGLIEVLASGSNDQM